jgi:hypothetical protein
MEERNFLKIEFRVRLFRINYAKWPLYFSGGRFFLSCNFVTVSFRLYFLNASKRNKRNVRSCKVDESKKNNTF